MSEGKRFWRCHRRRESRAACDGLQDAILSKAAMEVPHKGSMNIGLLMDSPAVQHFCHTRGVGT